MLPQLEVENGDAEPPSPPLPPPAHLKASSLLFLHSRCHGSCLCFSIISLQLLLVFLSFFSLPFPSLHLAGSFSSQPSCPLGKVYVYDLPPVFNKELIDGCDQLNPWTSPCTALSNHGFGPQATYLTGVVPANTISFWHSTDQFAAELIYHRRMLAHPCRSHDISNATAYYVPFYAGLAVGKHLWTPNATSGDRDRSCAELLAWLEKQGPWRRSLGWDHFIVLGRITWDFRRSNDNDWGGSFLHMPGMENITRLLIERNPWDDRDVGVPYPTGFHPNSAAHVRAWQNFVLNQRRSKLFGFAGAARGGFKGDFRGLLLDTCAKAGEDLCLSVDCSGGKCGNSSAPALQLFLRSSFCLQPRGDSFTRRSVFDCMVAGAIPVLFWKRSAYVQYQWFLPPGEEWSVFIDQRKVRSGAVNVTETLQSISAEKVRRLRERVVDLIPRLIYAGNEKGLGGGMLDAFDVALEGVLRRINDWQRQESPARSSSETADIETSGACN